MNSLNIYYKHINQKYKWICVCLLVGNFPVPFLFTYAHINLCVCVNNYVLDLQLYPFQKVFWFQSQRKKGEWREATTLRKLNLCLTVFQLRSHYIKFKLEFIINLQNLYYVNTFSEKICTLRYCKLLVIWSLAEYLISPNLSFLA